jgi:carbamate kinase
MESEEPEKADLPRAVIALGGNALIKRGEVPTIQVQRHNAGTAAAAVASASRTHHLVITHGNGPQVGLLAMQQEAAEPGQRLPLDVLVGETAGMIGYLLQQAISDLLPTREVATLLTRVEVDRNDPAYAAPTKPIGAIYGKPEADALAAEHGWTFAPDGPHWRRVVPSPLPQRIVEERTIRRLVEGGTLLICAGGGGIPVYRDEAGRTRGTEAVIDKDLTAELLARTIDADLLVLLTDVSGLYADWGTPDERLLREVTLPDLKAMDLDSGSMGPKVRAACRFVDSTGRPAVIGALSEAEQVFSGNAGTRITSGA